MEEHRVTMCQWILVTLLFARTLQICRSENSEPFLTWTISFNGNVSEMHFTEDFFNEFYECLCNGATTFCLASVNNENFLIKTGFSKHVNGFKSISTKYNCTFTYTSVSCVKLNVTDSACSNTEHCLTYSHKTSALNDKCDLPLMKLLPTPNINISLNYKDSNFENQFNVTNCAEGCLSQTLPPPFTQRPLLTTTTSSTFNQNSSASLSAESGLTDEQAIIIALAVSLAILIVALIILGVIVWRRGQKSRDHMLSNGATTGTLKNDGDHGIVNNVGDNASVNDIVNPNSTSKTSPALELETKDTTNKRYETIDLEPNPELGTITKTSVQSRNGNIKPGESKRRDVPSGLQNPYSEPDTNNVTGPYSTVDLDDPVGKVTITDKPQNGNSPKLPEPRSQDTPSASENPNSEPETNNINDPYTGINPNTKSKKKKNTADSSNVEEEAEDDPLNPQSKVTNDAGNNLSVSSTKEERTAAGNENDANNFLPDDESANAYSKLHETQRHFQNPYNILSDPLADAPDEPPAKLPSSNVDIIPKTTASTPAVELPVPKDVISDNGEETIEGEDISSEPKQSECDSDKNDENRKPDVDLAMHVSDNEEIKVPTDKGTLEYTGSVKNKTSATSPTETGTAKKNEYFQLESDAESSTEEEERD